MLGWVSVVPLTEAVSPYSSNEGMMIAFLQSVVRGISVICRVVLDWRVWGALLLSGMTASLFAISCDPTTSTEKVVERFTLPDLPPATDTPATDSPSTDTPPVGDQPPTTDDTVGVDTPPIGPPQWPARLGDKGFDNGSRVTTDPSGNVYACGYFSGEASFGKFKLTAGQLFDIYVVKLDANGNLVWALSGGGAASDFCEGIAANAKGEVFVTGYVTGGGTFGSNALKTFGNEDVYIAKVSSAGQWLWVKTAGNLSRDQGTNITVTPQGRLFATGFIYGKANLGGQNIDTGGNNDLYIAELDPINGEIKSLYSRAEQDSSVTPLGIVGDSAGNLYIGGKFAGGPGGTATFGKISLVQKKDFDAFVAKYTKDGTWEWATSLGSTGADEITSVAYHTSGIAVVGTFESTLSSDAGNVTSKGEKDGFVAWLDNTGKIKWVKRMGGPNSDFTTSVGINSKGEIVAAGRLGKGADIADQPIQFSDGSSETKSFVVRFGQDGSILKVSVSEGPGSDGVDGLAIGAGDKIFATGYFNQSVNFGGGPLTAAGSSDGYVWLVAP